MKPWMNLTLSLGVWLRTPNKIKPKDASILISYIEAFTGDLRYQLRDKELANLKTAQELAEKIEKNMQSSGKSNIPGYTRGNTSCKKETKDKAVESEENGTSKDPMEKVADMITNLVTSQNQQMANHTTQLNDMQDILITMERNNGPRNFQPKQNQMYQKKSPQQEPRNPNQLDSANMVEEVLKCKSSHGTWTYRGQ